MQTESFDTLQDFVGTFRPAKRGGLLVVRCRVGEQGGGELLHAAMDASAELASGQY